MTDNTWCKECRQDVRPKLNFSWLIFIATLLLFWPATIVYIVYKLYKRDYICPICERPLDV